MQVRLARNSRDKDDQLAAHISALVFLFFSLESYLNHLGERIRPDLWEGKKEREYFSGRQEIDGARYFGPVGKLQFLLVQCGLPYEESSDEITTILRLKQFRNLLAHGKTEEGTLHISSPSGAWPELVVPDVWKYVQSDLLELAYPHVKNLIERLHTAAQKTFPEADLESAAFLSSFWQTTDVR